MIENLAGDVILVGCDHAVAKVGIDLFMFARFDAVSQNIVRGDRGLEFENDPWDDNGFAFRFKHAEVGLECRGSAPRFFGSTVTFNSLLTVI